MVLGHRKFELTKDEVGHAVNLASNARGVGISKAADMVAELSDAAVKISRMSRRELKKMRKLMARWDTQTW